MYTDKDYFTKFVAQIVFTLLQSGIGKVDTKLNSLSGRVMESIVNLRTYAKKKSAANKKNQAKQPELVAKLLHYIVQNNTNV